MANAKKGPKLIYETKESMYEKGVDVMSSDELIINYTYKKESYLKAADMFESLGDFKDAPQLARECRARAEKAGAEAIQKKYEFAIFEKDHAQSQNEYKRAIRLFEEIKGYKEADSLCAECQASLRQLENRSKARKAIKFGLLAAAIVALLLFFRSDTWKNLKAEVFGFKMVNENIEGPQDTAEEEVTTADRISAISKASPGEKVTFGANDWYVCTVNEDGAELVLAGALKQEELCTTPYNEEQTDTSWEESTMRAWLNDTYLDQIFTSEEKEYLLSADELGDKISLPTADDVRNYGEGFSSIKINIWLRDQGATADTAMFMANNNVIMEYGYPVSCTTIYTAPKICVALQ